MPVLIRAEVHYVVITEQCSLMRFFFGWPLVPGSHVSSQIAAVELELGLTAPLVFSANDRQLNTVFRIKFSVWYLDNGNACTANVCVCVCHFTHKGKHTHTHTHIISFTQSSPSSFTADTKCGFEDEQAHLLQWAIGSHARDRSTLSQTIIDHQLQGHS